MAGNPRAKPRTPGVRRNDAKAVHEAVLGRLSSGGYIEWCMDHKLAGIELRSPDHIRWCMGALFRTLSERTDSPVAPEGVLSELYDHVEPRPELGRKAEVVRDWQLLLKAWVRGELLGFPAWSDHENLDPSPGPGRSWFHWETEPPARLQMAKDQVFAWANATNEGHR